MHKLNSNIFFVTKKSQNWCRCYYNRISFYIIICLADNKIWSFIFSKSNLKWIISFLSFQLNEFHVSCLDVAPNVLCRCKCNIDLNSHLFKYGKYWIKFYSTVHKKYYYA